MGYNTYKLQPVYWFADRIVSLSKLRENELTTPSVVTPHHLRSVLPGQRRRLGRGQLPLGSAGILQLGIVPAAAAAVLVVGRLPVVVVVLVRAAVQVLLRLLALLVLLQKHVLQGMEGGGDGLVLLSDGSPLHLGHDYCVHRRCVARTAAAGRARRYGRPIR